MGGHFPGCKVLGVTSPSRTATNNLDVIAFELNGRKDKLAFKYPGITNSTIESLWEPYIAQLAHSGHPVIAAQFFRLRGHITKMPINVTVPYLVKQLADKRPVFLLFASERTPNMRACDLVACFLLKELRSLVSHQTVLPNLPCDPYSTQHDGEGKPTDAAISQVLIWWNEQGRSLLERGQLCLPN